MRGLDLSLTTYRTSAYTGKIILTFMDEPIYISAERLQALKDEFHQLKTVTAREVAAHIDEAKQQGDLSENAEYHEAKERMGFVQGRIAELEHIISNAVVIEEKKKSGNAVHIGATVVVESGGVKRTYTIVGSNEANPSEGKISNESPMGEAFLGHAVGETVEVKTPVKTTQYVILEVK